MKNEQFELLVRKLEGQAKENPRSYRMKVLLLTGLGYGYVLLLLALLMFLLVVSVLYLVEGHFSFGSLKALLFSGTLSYFVIKALIVKMERPQGYYLKENEAPELEKTIRELSSKLKTPKIHAIVLDEEYNAAVVQQPKFGLFGPKENILIIGVPLMTSLTREQFVSVLAHELAHISHSDTAFGAMIYRVRMTWSQLMASLEKNEQFGTFLFRKFIQWFYPRYSAYTFVMARQEEYAADAAAARVTSPEAVRDTLCTIAVGGRYFYQQYFDELFEESSKTNMVPRPYSHLFNKTQTIDRTRAEGFLKDRLEMESGVADTHPCLRDRLKAVGLEPALPVNTESAIEFFFPNADRVLEHFNHEWVEMNAERWQEQVVSYNQAKQRLAELEAMEILDVDSRYERAILTRNLVGVEQAVPLFEGVIADFPAKEVTAAYLALGEIYLHKEETASRGEELIREAMAISWECKEEALDMLCDYYYHTGQWPAFEEARTQLEEWSGLLEKFEEECSTILENQMYFAHGKSHEELAEAAKVISSHPEILEAYLVRRESEVMPEREHFVLALKVEVPVDASLEEYTETLIEKYSKELYTFDGTYFYIVNGYEDLERKVKSVDGSLVYSRNEQFAGV